MNFITAASLRQRLRGSAADAMRTVLQVALLSVLWLLAEALRSRMGWSIPAGLIGFGVLALGLFTRLIPVAWLAGGTRWLLGNMLLFFIPAMLVVVDYGDLVRSQGWRILLVIVLSTIAVMAATAITVDAVYTLELRLEQRKRGRQRSRRSQGEAQA